MNKPTVRIGPNQLRAIVQSVSANTGFPLVLKEPWVGFGCGWKVESDAGAIIAAGTPTDVAIELRTWERGWSMARTYRHKGKHGTAWHNRGTLLVEGETS